MRRRYGAGIAAAAGAAAAGFLLARRWQLRWGATAEELAGPLPGDELVGRPGLSAARSRPLVASPGSAAAGSQTGR